MVKVSVRFGAILLICLLAMSGVALAGQAEFGKGGTSGVAAGAKRV